MLSSPTPSRDGLSLYYAASVGSSLPDVWLATRESTEALFEVGEKVASLATQDTEVPSWLSSDGCRLYFERYALNVPPDVYVASRLSACGDQLVDLDSDAEHCGTCDTACESAPCAAGRCQ